MIIIIVLILCLCSSVSGLVGAYHVSSQDSSNSEESEYVSDKNTEKLLDNLLGDDTIETFSSGASCVNTNKIVKDAIKSLKDKPQNIQAILLSIAPKMDDIKNCEETSEKLSKTLRDAYKINVSKDNKDLVLLLNGINLLLSQTKTRQDLPNLTTQLSVLSNRSNIGKVISIDSQRNTALAPIFYFFPKTVIQYKNTLTQITKTARSIAMKGAPIEAIREVELHDTKCRKFKKYTDQIKNMKSKKQLQDLENKAISESGLDTNSLKFCNEYLIEFKTELLLKSILLISNTLFS